MVEVGEIIELLTKEKYLSVKDAEASQANAEKSGVSQLDYLYANNIVSKNIVGQAIAEKYDVSYLDLADHMPKKEMIAKIEQNVAEKYRIILTEASKSTLVFAAEEPTRELGNKLSKLYPKYTNRLYFSFKEDIDQALLAYRSSLETRFSEIINSSSKIGPQIVEEIVKEAVSLKSSDIHFEPQKDKILIRLRVDGVLREAGTTEKQFYDVVVNRVKVLCKLRIDEHFGIQDGSMQVQVNEKPIDLRVSIVPTVNGEKIAIRILTEYISAASLTDLGMSDFDKNLIETATRKPHGMIVVTGPTGSGKTTTLYTILHAINSPGKNITTIEDPVEYRLDTINQIQVNPNTDLTFAKGLRSIVRQDPDVILVGEIRDQETADIAVNAALTGHLLLTTLHANNAATAIPRLLDMGVEPFLAASTLELLIAQRLIRKICSNCRYSYEYKQDKTAPDKGFGELDGLNVYAGKGCMSCGNSGYRGRIALFEIIPIDSAIREMMLSNPSTEQIWTLAKSNGARSLFQDGIDKVKQGATTTDEVSRVAEKN